MKTSNVKRILCGCLLFAATWPAFSQPATNPRLIIRADDMGSFRSANIACMEGYKNGVETCIEAVSYTHLVTVDAGVDILSFGGTKNGMMMGEAVVSFRPEITENLRFYRKQSAQLASKLRYLSAQFIPYLENNLWLENAMKANISAAKLADVLRQYPEIHFTQKIESNQLFFTIPAEALRKLQDKYFFYMWNEEINEARLVTSWDTSGEDIAEFELSLKEIFG